MYCFVFDCIYCTSTLPPGVNPIAVNIYHLPVCLSARLPEKINMPQFKLLFFITPQPVVQNTGTQGEHGHRKSATTGKSGAWYSLI
jgi:hypothetical protein